MRIIPAIDIIDGKCVRLTKGDYTTQKIYNENPLEVVKSFEDSGISYLHLVDLDGARSGHIVNHKVLHRIATQSRLSIDFGGGLKSNDDLRIAFENGASQITGGSIAAQDPALFLEWLSVYGKEKIILGADTINRRIATHGWLKSIDTDVVDFISDYKSKGVEYTICTDISKDGMLEGTSNELFREIITRTNIKLIASGGVSCFNDILQLRDLGCEGVIIGKAIYENRVSLKELKTLC